jgi:hypothetical protein
MKTRRGLSTVVGAVFLVAAVVSSLSYVSYSLNAMGDFSKTLIVEQALQRDKLRESFEVTEIKITEASKLDAAIVNTGQIPLEIKTLWIDEQGVDDEVKKFIIDKTITPGGNIKLIDSIDFDVELDKGYNIKITSGRGEIRTFYVNSPASNSLYLQTMTLPETISTEFDTVVLMSVTNNSTNNASILNLTPIQYPTIDTSSCVSCTVTYVSGPEPSYYPSLRPGETVIFKWVYTVAGANADKITFTTALQNGVATNTAKADVKVRDVVSAMESGISLLTIGLMNFIGTNDILYLQSETFGTPSGAYQLSPTIPDTPGNFVDINDVNPSWITNNGTSPITIPAGTWTLSLNYLTEFLPDDLILTGNEQVDMIFHLNDNASTESDSTGNTTGIAKCSGSSAPQYIATGGPDNESYYRFDGGDCFTSVSNVNNYSNIKQSPDTTAIWFRADSLSSTKAVMFRVDEGNGSLDNYYQISLGDGTQGNKGKIVFQFVTNNIQGPTKCMSNDRWDDNTWHLVVAVRDASNRCKLYMDGNTTPVATHTHSGSSDVKSSGKFKVGYSGSGEHFTGDIAHIFHWNDNALTPSQVSSLYNAKYGSTSTTVDFIIHKTDSDGNEIEQPIHINTDHPIKFADSKGLDGPNTYNSLADNIWKHVNYTTYMDEIVIESQQRLKLTIQYKEGLDMILRHDDATMNNPRSSFLQLPMPNGKFPAYFTYQINTPLSLTIHNTGDHGGWFTAHGTRAIFTNIGDGISYAGMLCAVNSTLSNPCSTDSANNNWIVSEGRDSIFVPTASTVNLHFWEIQDRPDRNLGGGSQIQAGGYHLRVIVNGYDESGKTFTRQIDIGKIEVYE